MTSKPYNGFKSWNQWNVSLWIGNDECLYGLAKEMLGKYKSVRKASERFVYCMQDQPKTPDGARYNLTSVMTALRGLKD